MIENKHLQVPIFTNTMFALGRVGKSVRNFTCALIFATDFGWVGGVLMEFECGINLAYKQIFKKKQVCRLN